MTDTPDAAPVLKDPAICVQSLTKVYVGRAVVDHLSFTVPRGTVCGFIGPNGAGKTTTIRLLLGLAAPTSGTGTVLGVPINRPGAFLHRVGAMIEGPAFYPTLSARQNLRALAALNDVPDRRVDHVLEIVDLSDHAHRPFVSYSLGMKQRVGIAAALLRDPQLLVLDEPTNGLDPPGIREVRALLRRLADNGATVFVSSHLLDELQHVVDHVVIIDNGHAVFDGPVKVLLDQDQPVVVAVPEDTRDLPRLTCIADQLGYPALVVDNAVELQATAPGSAAELNRAAMAAGITLVQLGTRHMRLEDAFFERTESRGAA